MPREWSVFLETQTWIWLGGGLLVTLRVAALVVLFSFVTGTLLALGRMSRWRPLHWAAATYIDTIRAVPVFLIIIFVFFGLPNAGIEVSTATSVTIALTIYATALIAEIIRAGILAVERGQIEAARSLGLSGVQTFLYVVFPQAMKMMVPPLVGQYIILIKHTSIGGVVGLDELLRRTVILYTGFQNPTQSLIVVAVIYFMLLFGLSMLSRRLELKDSRVIPQMRDEVFFDQPRPTMLTATPPPT
jgi:His/Glu/Gln/Arg/opine family amino acid ABC transporter permease subunit